MKREDAADVEYARSESYRTGSLRPRYFFVGRHVLVLKTVPETRENVRLSVPRFADAGDDGE